MRCVAATLREKVFFARVRSHINWFVVVMDWRDIEIVLIYSWLVALIRGSEGQRHVIVVR